MILFFIQRIGADFVLYFRCSISENNETDTNLTIYLNGGCVKARYSSEFDISSIYIYNNNMMSSHCPRDNEKEATPIASETRISSLFLPFHYHSVGLVTRDSSS